MLDQAGLSSEEWQTASLLINLPSLNYSAAVMLAMLHGRLGYFPAVLHMRRVSDAVPIQFEVAKVINLQGIRERERCDR